MPFMPEMIPYLGRRFTVSARADKICDTIGSTLQSRRMTDTVLLEDLRCNGGSHGGCQADCRIYWNEAWLKKVDQARRAGRHTGRGRHRRAAGAHRTERQGVRRG